MKTIKVVAAVIKSVNTNGDSVVFATQRGYGKFKGRWDFPGGKIEVGETPQQALAREIREELDTDIYVGDLIDSIEFDYPEFHLSMNCYLCEVIKGGLTLKEHLASKWLTKEELWTLDWLPADEVLLERIAEII